MPAGPAIEVAHVRTQAGLVLARECLGVEMAFEFGVVGGDVGAVAVAVEQVTAGFAIRADAGADGGLFSACA